MTFNLRTTRRSFLQHSAATAVPAMLGFYHRPATSPSVLRSTGRHLAAIRNSETALVDPTTVQTLALRAIDAAHSAGARYADVRLTRTVQMIGRFESERLGVGVRTLVDGFWGFSASPYWTPDEMVRLAQDAVAQAQVNAGGTTRPVELGTLSAVTGSWVMPVQRDPFRVTREEREDALGSLESLINQMLPHRTQTGARAVGKGVDVLFGRQEHALATTDGTYITQTVYYAKGACKIVLEDGTGWPVSEAFAEGLGLTGCGWELLREARILDQLPAMVAAAEEDVALKRHRKPVAVGRYDVVCDAATMANVLDATFGRATELDRALGYEANAGGTSYLGPDPMACLGTSVASPLVSVTANRSQVKGLATVKWDAEGVVPDDFTLVKAGVLVDYQTTREQAAWLAPWYARQGTPVHSHGCAGAESAQAITMQRTPNLALTPSASNATGADLITGMRNGIVIYDGGVDMDFQARNGIISGKICAVRDGMVVGYLDNAGVLFNTMELWKNVTALGGVASTTHTGVFIDKGEPSQETAHTLSAVPAIIKQLAVVDVTRKA